MPGVGGGSGRGGVNQSDCFIPQEIKKKIHKCKEEKSPILDLSKADVSANIVAPTDACWLDAVVHSMY